MTQRHGDAVQLDMAEFKRFIRHLLEGCRTTTEIHDMLWDMEIAFNEVATEVYHDRPME